MSDRTRRGILLALLVAAVCPYFLGLGDSAIWDANEAFYVETPREMMERGDFISPTFNYEPRFNKPVLSYWIVAGFYKLFGISVAVQRLPIALGALVLVLGAWALARMASPGVSSSLAAEAGLWAALGLAIAPRLVMFARRIFIDIYISMFMALTLVFFAASERYPHRRRLFLALMYLSVGLGVLTKGPVAAAVPGLAFAVYLVVHRELRRARDMMVPAGVLIVLAIVVPWYAALYTRYEWTYIKSFFVGENVERFATGLGVQVDRPVWFYLPVVFTDSFPWSLYLVPAAMFWWRHRRAMPATDLPARIRTLCWIWIVTITGFFSLSAAKQDLYIFPIVPAVTALAGVMLLRAASGERGTEDRAIRWTTIAIGVLLGVSGVALLLLFTTAGAAYAIRGVGLVGAVGVVGGLAAAVLAGRSVARGAFVLSAAFIVVVYVFVLATLPSFEAYKPVPGFASTLTRLASPTDVVATYEQAMPSLVYYLRRHVVEIEEPGPLVEMLASDKTFYVVISEDDYQAVQKLTNTHTCVVDRRPTFDVRLKNVLARRPLPQLILITNRCAAQG